MDNTTFKREIEALGYSIRHGKNLLYVEKRGYSPLMSVGFRSTHIVDTDFKLFAGLDSLEKEKLLSLAWKLASTPIAKRNNEKRYQLRLPFFPKDESYLNKWDDGGYFMSDRYDSIGARAVFTGSEIVTLSEKHSLDSFIMEEVKEGGS